MFEDLEARLHAYPRVPLARVPTPLEEAPRLSAALGGPRILIKRDDLTGLALGGNKIRKLEYLVGAALEHGADCLITIGAEQSNHCRQTAGAAARVGLACYLVLRPPFHGQGQGNELLDEILGATIIRCAGDQAAVDRAVEDLLARLRAEGRRPFLIPVGGSTATGALGYVECAIELERQLRDAGIRPTKLYVSSGSSGTHAGLEAGAAAVGASWRTIGISPSGKTAPLVEQVARLTNETAALIGLDRRFSPAEITVDDRYVGPAYGTATPECVEAIRLVARTEGVLLDPVYTGKVMAGLIDHARRGSVGPEDTVVFVHTGGNPALFAYAGELAGR